MIQTSLPGDQIQFLACHAFGLALSIPYRWLVPTKWRHEFNFIPGLLMVYYCFNDQAHSFVLYSVLSYLTIRLSPSSIVHRTTLCVSLAFLSYAHMSRQIMDYGGYVIDISGPFMIAVQKMTSLGFCLHDGSKLVQNTKKENDDGEEEYVSSENNEQPLTDEQRLLAVKHKPSLRQFLGYFFQYSAIMCGPIVYFNDYIDTVECEKIPPGAFRAAFQKLSISATSAFLLLTLSPMFEVNFLRSSEFLHSTPLWLRFGYITVFTMLSRLKYYVAWHLGECVSNSIGFGYNGSYTDSDKGTSHDRGEGDKHKSSLKQVSKKSVVHHRWDKCSNMDLWKFETSLNFRDAILAWNKTTQTWLRRTAYERAPKFRVLATYVLSAVWHGFYPGYYMTFLGGALFTQASRLGRRHIRPWFKSNGPWVSTFYDVVTFILTRLTIAYIAFPFVILDFANNVQIYKSLYFSLHILGLILIVYCSCKAIVAKKLKINKKD